MVKSLEVLKFLVIIFVSQASGQNNNAQCEERSCYPATGDLLIGRAPQLKASSTCGMKGPEDYCIVSHLQDSEECFVCDSSVPTLSHLPENVISTFNGNKEKTWWQSENKKENVYIQLDLEAQFHFTHLVMTFRTFRPAGMFIERSWNYGRNWTIYRYFAADCDQTFPGIPKGPQEDVDDIVCTQDFSSVEPSTGGEVIFRALNPQIPVKNPYSEKVQNLLKLTNIRINFTKLHTLGDLVLDPTKPETKLKYYYAVYDLVIRGSCSCYGHAEQCLPLAGQPIIPGMVHGQCDCTHNTEGKNCERCKAGYNDRPWKPATSEDTNECRRCDCNGHATECRFDPAVYAASGNVSGGVCISCQHNTVGRKCEKCKPLHYQDPNKDFRERDSCVPCNCDSVGGVSGGECEGKYDPDAGLVAGRCICKKNVEGQRCNRCKPGFWNLRKSNPDGCEACGCSADGTIRVCDPQTGKCTCKRFVMGARCDRCQPGYWGLDESLAGCHSCDCDVGGSYERNCEQIKGQCRCRKGITGRRCDTVQTGNFFPLPDHLTYESEEARVIGEGEVVPREPPPGDIVTWTGDGFTEVKDNAALEYAVTNVPYTGEYNILVRYEPKDSGIWKVNVNIERLDGLPLISGKCKNATNARDPNYGNFSAILSTPRRYVLMLPSVCMEKDVAYVVKVTYSRHESNTGVDTILTDSMVLLPSAESVSIFQGPDGEQRKKQFDRFRCLDYHLSATRPRPRLPDVCKRLIFAMSSVIYDGGQPCNCDPTGTKRDVNGTLICDAVGGQCECKPNVVGQRCDRCTPGSYGFGPQGCGACNCDSIGSSDNLCNIQSGQCSCRIKAWGRQCNLCPPSNWGFPLCRPCRCNNHATTCQPKTGFCIDCQHNTAGRNCEVCAIGFYGDATLGTPNDCRRCQCPGGSSGNQFSKTCFLDRSTTPPASICDGCELGYTGKQCEQCDDGYYGNPLVPGGRCQPCSCSNNIDPTATGNCDRLTGSCLACLYNTAGFSCERCKQGYYGDALVRNCTECVCDARGTDSGFVNTCNYATGQCNCLSNVIGTRCDKCADGFWNLDNGQGCEKCDCCGEGSTQATCNELNGQCKCKAGYGGSRCCECENGYWGKPLGSCRPCNCNPSGSTSIQCDRETGKCQCKPGMVGEKCDQCDVDTSGKMPRCEVCGECYYQWKVTLNKLSRNISVEIARALNFSLTPRPGDINAYDKELKELQEKLEQVEMILKSQVINENETKAIEDELDVVNSRLRVIQDKVDRMDDELNSTVLRTVEADIEIDRLRRRLANLLQNGEALKSEAEKILGSDIRGAFDQILKNQMRSRDAEKSVNDSEKITDMSRNERGNADRMIEGPPSFGNKHAENTVSLDDINKKIQTLLEQVELLNGVVCGTPSSKCGGCGTLNCSTCGGPGCNGSVELGAEALTMAKKAEEAQRIREANAKEMLQDVHDAEMMVNMTRRAAEEAVMRAMEADNRAKNASTRMDRLIQDILEFLEREFGNPEEIRRVANLVLGLTLSVTPEEVEKLAEDIRKALASLTDIDFILETTKGDLETANGLKERAMNARAKARAVADVVRNVTDALVKAADSQKAAQSAITKTQDNIKMAEDLLNQLLPDLDAIERAVDIARGNVTEMQGMVPMVKDQFKENEEQMEVAKEVTRDAYNHSKLAMEEAVKLRDLFTQAEGRIQGKVQEVEEASSKVLDLQDMGNELVNQLAKKLDRILIIERETITFEDLIEETKKLQDEMRVLLDKIRARYTCYRNCNPKVISEKCN